ncbi:MAG: HK97 family phage prohead protease [Thiotrichaceae bacterium]
MIEEQQDLFNEIPFSGQHHIFTRKANFQTEVEGSIKGVGLLFGLVPDRPMILTKEAFASSCGGTVPLIKGHLDDGDFKVVGSVKILCGEKGINIDGSFNFDRDPKTDAFMVPLAAEMFALTKNGDITGISAGIEFDEDGFEFDDETGIITVVKAEITEFSLVVNPAIPGARVTEVMNRHKPNVNRCPVDYNAVRAAIIETRRRLQNV